MPPNTAAWTTTNPFDVGTSASGTGTTANSGTVTTTAPGTDLRGRHDHRRLLHRRHQFTTRIITNPDADIAQDRTVTTAGAYNATAP